MSIQTTNTQQPKQMTLSQAFINVMSQEKGFKAYVDEILRFVDNDLKDDKGNVIKTNQLRNLLDKVILIKNSHEGGEEDTLSTKTQAKLAMLRPQLYYMAAREKKLDNLVKQLDSILKNDTLPKTGKYVNYLYELVASIVAYHKYLNENK